MVFLYLKADGIGAGTDAALSRKLLESFLDKLAHSDIAIDAVGCVNGAVKLTTQDGPALDSLRTLQARGARIASCGTCLDHLGLREQLRIGEVGSMDVTVHILATADRVISPC